jgi:ABC-type uncharacterized transport system involved in gliding motility auxiliary subunit
VKSTRQKLLGLVLLLTAVILVNDLASRVRWQADLTSERFFTLSEGSREMLAGLKSPVQVELYFSASRKSVPIGLKVFAQRVAGLLRQYEQVSGGNVQVRIIDPVPGSRDEEEARRLELQARPIGPDETLYFGLAVFHGANHRVIPLIDYRRERLLEFDISRIIAAVQTHRLPKLAVATSLEVFGRRGMPKEQQRVEDGTAEWQFIRELRLAYDVREVQPTDLTLPADTDLVLVINPTGFDPRLLHAIDQFILSGRPAVLLLDPYNYFEVERDETDGPVLGAQYYKRSDLPEFRKAWGLTFSTGAVVGDLANPTEVPVQENQPPVSLPVWISLSQFDDSQPVTAGLDLVTLAHAGSLGAAPGSPVQFTPLLRSSTNTASLPIAELERMNPALIADNIHPTGEACVLAAFVEGTFPTAFPDGMPAPPPGAGSSDEPDPWNLGLKISKQPGRVIVVADADFIKDQLAYETVSRTGSSFLSKPRNNNVAFLANCLETVRRDRELPSIRARAHAIHPFVRVHQMRVAAEDQFHQEMQSIAARMNDLDRELAELNQKAAQGGGELVSEKAMTAIRRAQKEQNALRGRRLEIRQQLQQRIEGLDARLTLLNLAVVPSIIAMGGIALWLYRTRRRVVR